MLDRLLSFLPVPVAVPLNPLRSNTYNILDVLANGLLWATPKRKIPLRKKWAQRYGHDNWTHGTKLWKPKTHIVTCHECGDFHEIANICRNCYNKIAEKTKSILASESEHPSRIWFASNLAQPKAPNDNKPIEAPTKED